MAEYENSFVIIGGQTNHPNGGSREYIDKIYRYDTGSSSSPGDDQWVEVPTTLGEKKIDFAAIKVKASHLNSC